MTTAVTSRQLEATLIAPSKASRIHRFGGPEVITLEDMVPAAPGRGEVLVRVKAAGVGPWDAWIRAGKSALPQPLPLTLGSDISGVVEAVGPGVTRFVEGDEVFGVTNPNFTGGYADYALTTASMLATHRVASHRCGISTRCGGDGAPGAVRTGGAYPRAERAGAWRRW